MQKSLKAKIIALSVFSVFLLAIAAIIFTISNNNSLNAKINEYSKNYGVSVSEIKKDKSLLKQLEIETKQEEKLKKEKSAITVSSEEITKYREMIGNTMDKKKAVLVLFNTYDECRNFISEYGGKDNDYQAGIGVVPMMETDSDSSSYYNVAGNAVLEGYFDSLKDGEYTQDPVLFSGMHCYLKRLSVYSPVSNDSDIIEYIKIEYIKNEKAQTNLQSKKSE